MFQTNAHGLSAAPRQSTLCGGDKIDGSFETLPPGQVQPQLVGYTGRREPTRGGQRRGGQERKRRGREEKIPSCVLSLPRNRPHTPRFLSFYNLRLAPQRPPTPAARTTPARCLTLRCSRAAPSPRPHPPQLSPPGRSGRCTPADPSALAGTWWPSPS